MAFVALIVVPMVLGLFTPEHGLPSLLGVRGWMSQQLRKIAFAAKSPTERIMFVDSDVAFIRPFDPATLDVDGKSPLFAIDWFNKESLGWANQTRKLFGQAERPQAHGYVHPTFWRKSTVLDMLSELERVNGKPWAQLLSGQRTLSEWTLYGIFAEEVKKLAGHYLFNQPLMHPSWDYGRDTDRFFAELPTDCVAMMFHSKDKVSVSAYRERVEGLWSLPMPQH